MGVTDKENKFVVDVANPGKPIANDSGMLILDNTGTLKILHLGGDPVVLYSSAQRTMNTVATLLDSGKFILKEMYFNGSTIRGSYGKVLIIHSTHFCLV